MLIIATGWIYVVLLMALTEPTVIAGCLTFLLYGVAPVCVLLYLSGVRIRRRNRHRAATSPRAGPAAGTPDAATEQRIDARAPEHPADRTTEQ
jgi:hypothetical protein